MTLHTLLPRCKECNREYDPDENEDDFDCGLCYHCFEAGVERAEERRLRRIAEQNEY